MEQDFHESHHARVLDLNAGDFAVARGDGKGQPLKQKENRRRCEPVLISLLISGTGDSSAAGAKPR